MTIFFKFLASLIAHMAWQRIGGAGPVPPVRMPRGGKTMNLPVIAPWQMMLTMWMVNKLWKQYGNQVKTGLTDHNHPVAKRIGSILPDAPAPQPSPTPANGSTWTTTPATASTQPAAPAATPPPKSYGTQKLDSTPSSPLLSQLRGSQPANG